jgi:hypothetical protein
VSRLLVENLTSVVAATGVLFAVLAGMHRAERRVSRFLSRRIGWRASLYPTAILGVPLHEISHLAAARIFGHRIVGYSLFEPDPSTGTLGYVRHAYRRRNAWQVIGNFFVGIAPFVVGALALVLIGATMLPADARLTALDRAQKLLAGWTSHPHAVLAHLRACAALFVFVASAIQITAWLPVQIYLAVAVASHMAPSSRDLAGGLGGGLLFAFVVAGAASLLAATELRMAPLLLVLIPVCGFALLAVALQTAYVIAVAVLTRPTRRSVTVALR